MSKTGKGRNIDGRGVRREKGRVSASREVLVRYRTNNPQRFTILHYQLLNLPHDRTIQVLSIGGNPPRESNNTTAKIAPSTENKVAKRTMAYPSFTNSSESELKAPSVLKIEAFFRFHFGSVLLIIIFYRTTPSDGSVG